MAQNGFVAQHFANTHSDLVPSSAIGFMKAAPLRTVPYGRKTLRPIQLLEEMATVGQ